MRKLITVISLICVFFIAFARDTLPTIEEEIYIRLSKEKNAKKVIESLENKNKKEIEDLYTLSLLYYYQGNIFKCLQYCERILKIISKSTHNPEPMGMELKVTRLMGAAYTKVGYMEEGINLLEKVKKFYLEQKDTSSVCIILNSIASSYARNGLYSESLKKYQEILNQYEKHIDKHLKIIIFTNLVLLHSIMKEYSTSLSYLDSIKPYQDTLSPRLKNSYLLYSIYPYLHYQKKQKAIENFRIAEEYYFKNGAYTSLIQHYPIMLRYFIREKMYDDLIFYHERYLVCLDSVKKIEQNKSYERTLLEQERQKNIEMKHIIEIKQSKIRNKNMSLLLLGSCLLLIIFGFGFLYKKMQLKRIKEKQQAQELLILQHQKNELLQQQRIQQLEENQKLKEYINSKLEDEVKQRTQELLQKEKEVLELQQQKMELQIQQAEKEALTQTLLLQEKMKLLENLYGQIQDLAEKSPTEKQKKQLLEILHFLKHNINTEAQWESFKTYFENLYPTFMQKIAETYPQLTQQELRYIAYFKLGLSNKEIAKLLNITPAAVRVAKHRIKEKIKDQNSGSELLEILHSKDN